MSRFRPAWLCSLPVALLATPVAGDNLVPEGHFDLPADVTVFVPDGADALIAWNGALDVDDCGAASGGANVTSNSTAFGDTVNFRVCIEPVVPDTLYRFGGSAYFTPQAQTAEIWFELRFQIQPGCGEGHVDNNISPTAPASNTFVWQRVSTTAMSPSDAVGAMLSISLFKQSSSGSVFGTADAVFLRPAAEIHFEDFETGSTCRWSGASS